MAIGAYVVAGYEFLMQNCGYLFFDFVVSLLLILSSNLTDEAGDKICIFGFSRGAYTARALAGMIHKVRVFPPL